MNWNDIHHFSKSEFDCKCGCGGNEMDEMFILKLDTMRELLGFPLRVTSGYRCPAYNDRISSTGTTGPHTTGHAADLAVFGRQAYSVLAQAMQTGYMTGIGPKQSGAHASRFIHLDDLEPNNGRYRPTVWTY